MEPQNDDEGDEGANGEYEGGEAGNAMRRM
jgi:hypothetical protein